MTLFEFFDQREVDIIIQALTDYHDKCKRLAQRKITGYGKATEYAKRDEWKIKQLEAADILSSIVEYTT